MLMVPLLDAWAGCGDDDDDDDAAAAAAVGLLATGVEVAGLETVLAGADAEVESSCLTAFCCCAAAGLAMVD